MQRAEDVLEAAKKQTVYEVLLNAMAAAKTKHSVELGPGSLYGQLISRTRAMPPDVKAMLGHEAAEAAAEAAPKPRSRSRSKSRTRSGDLGPASASTLVGRPRFRALPALAALLSDSCRVLFTAGVLCSCGEKFDLDLGLGCSTHNF